MKTKPIYLVGLFLIGIYVAVQAQSTPEAFLSRLPAVPEADCSADIADINRFQEQIDRVTTDMRKEIERIHTDAQTDVVKNREINSEIQARKAAEKSIGVQYGVSMEELEKLGEMSDAEQEKWARSYADRMMNQAQKEPATVIEKGDKAKRMVELSEEQKSLGERITARMNRIAAILRNVEQTDSIETLLLETKIVPLEKDLCSGICTDEEIARSRIAEKKIHAHRVDYCQKMTPIQSDAILQYLNTLKALLPDYRKLTEIQNEIVGLHQLGELMPPDLSSYAAVEEYALVLSNAYKYRVGRLNEQ